MAFDRFFFSLLSNPPRTNCPNIWTYVTTDDNAAAVRASAYFNPEGLTDGRLAVNDIIYAVSTDGEEWLTVTAITPNVTTQVATNTIGDASITTAKLADLAVTNAKLANDSITADKIADLEITNADVSASAAIAFSKLEPMASATVLVGSGANVATEVAMTGDVTISNTGVTALAADSIVNADVNSAAAIDYSKLAALPSAEILVGSAGAVPTARAMSGDVAIDNAGATTIQALAVETGMLADDSVTNAKLAEDTVQYAEVTISTAELLDLAANPKELVAAPGADKVIQFLGAELILDYNSVAYTEAGDNMAVRYTDGSGAIVSETIESTGFIDQTADTLTNAIPKKDVIVAATGAVNQALVLDNTGSEFAAGNSPVRVKVTYKVITAGL